MEIRRFAARGWRRFRRSRGNDLHPTAGSKSIHRKPRGMGGAQSAQQAPRANRAERRKAPLRPRDSLSAGSLRWICAPSRARTSAGDPLHDVLIAHLVSHDFFDVELYPEARFVITATERLAGATPGAPNLAVRGGANAQRRLAGFGVRRIGRAHRGGQGRRAGRLRHRPHAVECALRLRKIFPQSRRAPRQRSDRNSNPHCHSATSLIAPFRPIRSSHEKIPDPVSVSPTGNAERNVRFARWQPKATPGDRLPRTPAARTPEATP